MKIRTKCSGCGQMNVFEINSLIGLSPGEIQLLRQHYIKQRGSFPVTQESIAALGSGPLTGPKSWISVKDRLPEKSGAYLVYAPSADPENPLIVSAWFELDEDGKGNMKGWQIVGPWAEAITHWMPLPVPPKEAS